MCRSRMAWSSVVLISMLSLTYAQSNVEKATIKADGGFEIVHEPSGKYKAITDTQLTIEIAGTSLLLNGKKVPEGVVIITPTRADRIFTWNKKQYQGQLRAESTTDGYVLQVISSSTTEPAKEPNEVTIQEQKGTIVKVLIDSHDLTAATTLTVTLVGGGTIVHDGIVFSLPHKHTYAVTVDANDHALTVDNRVRGSHVLLVPHKGMVLYSGRAYRGLLELRQEGERLMCINHVSLEDYVCSVLRTESWPGWPLEVNKVLAIAVRSYVLAMIARAQRVKRPYHVGNTNYHQTYTGDHDDPVIKKAVEQTKGQYLSYRNEPVLAMFDACCGGVVPAQVSTVDFNDAPYLYRQYACTHCKNSRGYRWTLEVHLPDIEKKMAHELKRGKRIKEIKVARKDKAGLVNNIIVKSGKKTVNLSYTNFKSYVKGIKSRCFLISQKPGVIVVNGKGIGHHLGLCQWGAKKMVTDGWRMQDVLKFYYPHTQIEYLTE